MAHIPLGKGDLYFAGGLFGVAVEEVQDLVKACRANLEADRAVNVKVRWQPTKVMFPEYIWDEELGGGGAEIMVICYTTLRKNMKKVKENICGGPGLVHPHCCCYSSSL